MEFKPYYEYDYEINLQDLSQRVKLFGDSIPELSIRAYEYNIALLISTSTVPIIKSKSDVIREFRTLKEHEFFNRCFKPLDLAKGEEASLEYYKNQLVNDSQVGSVLFDNPAWPINYLFLETDLNDDLKISDSACLNFLSQIKIDKSNPNFDYFFLLKLFLLRFDSTNLVRRVQEFLDYHLKKEFQNNLESFSLFLIQILANNDCIQPQTNIQQFIRDWIDMQAKFTRSRENVLLQNSIFTDDKYRELIVKYLLPLINKECVKDFELLINGDSISKPIVFKGKAIELVRTFVAFNQLGTINIPDLPQWIHDNLKFTNSKTGGATISLSTVKKYQQDFSYREIKNSTLNNLIDKLKRIG